MQNYKQFTNCSVLCLISGISLSTSGLFLTPIAYISLVIPYALSFLKKNRKEIFKVFLCSIIVATSIIIFEIVGVCQVRSGLQSAETSSMSDISAQTRDAAANNIKNLNTTTNSPINNNQIIKKTMGILKPFINKPWFIDFYLWMAYLYSIWGNIRWGYIISYVIAIIVIVRYGSRKDNFIFLGCPLVMITTFLNPFFSKSVMKHITSSATYWRLWIAIPIFITIGYGFVLIMERQNTRIKFGTLFAVLSAIILLTGKPIFSKYESASNIYHLDNSVVVITDYIVSNDNSYPIVLYNQDISYQARQYSAQIRTIARPDQYADSIVIDKYTLDELFDDIYRKNDISQPTTEKALSEMGVRYIVCNKELKVNSAKVHVMLANKIDDYNIYELAY